MITAILFDGLRILLAIIAMAAFSRARNRAMSRWAVSIAEDYLGMTLEEYHKKNEENKKKQKEQV